MCVVGAAPGRALYGQHAVQAQRQNEQVVSPNLQYAHSVSLIAAGAVRGWLACRPRRRPWVKRLSACRAFFVHDLNAMVSSGVEDAFGAIGGAHLS